MLKSNKRIKFNCDGCGKETEQIKSTYIKSKTHTCSRECSNIARKKAHNKICKFCGVEYHSIRGNKPSQVFCSTKCRGQQKSKDNSFLINCIECGIEFKTHRYRKEGGRKYCSRKCMGKGQSKLPIRHRLGVENPKYNPLIHGVEKDRLDKWGKDIKRRDNYTCKMCGEQNKRLLEAHHIKLKSEFPELRFNLDNGITLCLTCHASVHSDNYNIQKLILGRLKQRTCQK